ncbi:MAG: hypothetical protein K6G89_06395 [Clostridia bacterium]|nr:hypothetical protein [Clostridia bacterium]
MTSGSVLLLLSCNKSLMKTALKYIKKYQSFFKKVLDRVVLWWYYGRAPQKRGVTDIEN